MNFKKMLALMATMAMPASAFAQEASMGDKIEALVTPIFLPFVKFIFYSVPVGGASFPLIVGWLFIAAVIFTVYFGLIQFRGFGHSISLVSGKYTDPNSKEDGEVSHFQALATACSGTVGLGNIAGVAVAVSIGGAGATFWMILGGLFGMASKFTECTLGVKYRNQNADGTVSGGPMYYLTKGFAEKGMAGFGKVLAVIFAIMCILGSLGGGNMFQANQAYKMVEGTYSLGLPGFVFGAILAMVVFWVIIGGLTSIAKVTEKVVPFMAGVYLLAALVIIIMNADKLGWAFGQIFSGAFSPEGIAGGFVGVLIQGFKRATFSNEAGVGSAAIAHSAVKTNEPVTEGYVALLEPFIDTVVICTMTALVIIITGSLNSGVEAGVPLTSYAFSSQIPFFEHVLAVAVVLFAFSTMISWSYYGLKAWTYLFGENKAMELVYKVMFCIFIVIGAAIPLGIVIDFSDAAIFAMSIANIIGLYFLADVVKAELKSYRAKIASGEIKRYA